MRNNGIKINFSTFLIGKRAEGKDSNEGSCEFA